MGTLQHNLEKACKNLHRNALFHVNSRLQPLELQNYHMHNLKKSIVTAQQLGGSIHMMTHPHKETSLRQPVEIFYVKT